MIMAAIQKTNDVIAPTKIKSLWDGDGGHPAWYYGNSLKDGELVLDATFGFRPSE
jgi:hypothetical protein